MGKFRDPLMVMVFFAGVIFIGLQGLAIIEKEHRLTVGKSLNAVIHTIDEALTLWSNNHRVKAETIARRHEVVSLTEQLLTSSSRAHTQYLQKQIRELLNPEIIAFGYQGFFIIALDAVNMSSMRDVNLGETNLIALQRGDLFDKVVAGQALIVPPILSDVPLMSRDNQMRTLPPTMFAAAPIRNAKGAVIAVLAIRIDSINSFSRIMRLGRIGDTGETYAFDSQGIMLTESRFEDELFSLGIINRKEGSSLNIQLLDPQADLTTGEQSSVPVSERSFTYSVKQGLLKANGFNVEGYRDYRGVKVMGSWSWHSELNIGIATEIDVSEAMNSFVISRNAILGSLCLTAILAAALSLIMVRNRSKALEYMSQNQTALETQVAERTESLMKMNTDLQSQIIERVRTEEKLKRVQQDLEGSNRKLKTLASSDGLTGIPNRRAFDNKLSELWKKALKRNAPVSLLMMDVDDFKKYNDTYGHQAGDVCLKSIAKILELDNGRDVPQDIVARYGGEEFAMILSNTDFGEALKVAEMVRRNLAFAEIPFSNTGVEGQKIVTMSIGVATLTPSVGQGYESLIKQADEALYQAKARGRNRVEGANS
ncbi:diguanylate cyclase [Vibrio sp. T187]|uniref:diguanylate cyclase n=1 Tax=Vibrio TaxID=662 RepID=UPI0010CA19DF|nr:MULTISPECIES: diguanylate cyclase [Vibrio]MBW3696138.1 diguanylate cyclase [Vibrio sp. T187]